MRWQIDEGYRMKRLFAALLDALLIGTIAACITMFLLQSHSISLFMCPGMITASEITDSASDKLCFSILLFIPTVADAIFGWVFAPVMVYNLIEPRQELTSFAMWFLSACMLVNFLYHAVMESSHWSATLGKRVMGLQVTDLSGKRLSFKRAALRQIAKVNALPLLVLLVLVDIYAFRVQEIVFFLLAFVSCAATFATYALTPSRQALHDKLTGTLVDKKANTSELWYMAQSAYPNS